MERSQIKRQNHLCKRIWERTRQTTYPGYPDAAGPTIQIQRPAPPKREKLLRFNSWGELAKSGHWQQRGIWQQVESTRMHLLLPSCSGDVFNHKKKNKSALPRGFFSWKHYIQTRCSHGSPGRDWGRHCIDVWFDLLFLRIVIYLYRCKDHHNKCYRRIKGRIPIPRCRKGQLPHLTYFPNLEYWEFKMIHLLKQILSSFASPRATHINKN
jgi:hypothetical protein